MEGKRDTMSVQETIATLGISRATLYNWMKAGIITPLPKPAPLKKRGHTRFRRADVERLATGEAE